jgi:2-C-methyl-D-erythritol 2,4-cyclodiphosphate synthase
VTGASRAAVRVGIGYDSHPFADGGPLVLGGVTIPAEVRLRGHSDGDAVAHAITDAILGAVGQGDIGVLFPDTDPANAGRDSMDMLRESVKGKTNEGMGWIGRGEGLAALAVATLAAEGAA